MRLRRLNNAIHRDVGCLLAGTTILYALSGLALNHVDHWNPNFVIRRESRRLTIPKDLELRSPEWARAVLKPLGEQGRYRGHDLPSPDQVKIYLDDGSVLIDLASGRAVHESVRRRPLLFRMNCLHVSPERTWRVASDVFAVALIVVTATGLFMFPGRRGITGRGAALATAGLVIPLVFLFFV